MLKFMKSQSSFNVPAACAMSASTPSQARCALGLVRARELLFQSDEQIALKSLLAAQRPLACPC